MLKKVKMLASAVILCLFVSLFTFSFDSFVLTNILEIINCKFQNKSIAAIEAKILADLAPQAGWTPVRSVIVSSWRSGSSFLANIVNSVPGNYYHCEPLSPYGITQIRGPPNDTQAVSDIKNLLNCDYTNMSSYFEFSKEHQYVLSCNKQVWKTCQNQSEICYQPRFLSHICDQFPLQSMKLVRLRLKVAQQLLEDASLNVKIVLLVRDPRGILQSRSHEIWCPKVPDCDDPQLLCADMVSDYQEAVKLVKKYPMAFKAVRYEDLSMSPHEKSKEILQFFGRPFSSKVEDFLEKHTKVDDGRSDTLFKDSKTNPYKWIKKLTFEEIRKIQESCEEAIKLWGYKMLTETDDPERFSPFESFPGFQGTF